MELKRMTEQKTNLAERFEFRAVRPEEAEWAAEIEQICFPPNEACSPKSLSFLRISRCMTRMEKM